MTGQDNLELASLYSDKTNKFMYAHKISPTPINYSVLYHYVSENNKDLNTSINNKIVADEAIDSIFINELFEQHISNSESIRQSILIPFEKSLNNTLEKLDDHVTHGEKVSSNLVKVGQILSSTEHNASMQTIVNYLVGTISQSKIQHQSLSKELNKTCDEVNQLKSQLKKSQEEAILDALTGLLNRRGCDDKLKEINIKDVHTSLAIDIDHFKKVNDNFGHSVGDKVIQRIAKVIKDAIGVKDLAVRYGGEEFVVVMVNKTQEEAKVIAENIRIAITELKLIQRKSNTYLPTISVSIGIAQINKDLTWLDLFKRADEALYLAKNSGRNCCVAAK